MQIFSARVAAGAIALAALITIVACGGGERSAEDRLPDLDGDGFDLVEQITDPFAEPGVDNRLALYQGGDGRGVQVRVYVYEDEFVAEDRYATLATALENPPPEFVGAEAEQSEIDALAVGDESRSFVTSDPDQTGNRVWTDIARGGRVIAIAQLLAPDDDSDHVELRASIVGDALD